MIFSLPTCFQSSPTPNLPSRTKCWPVWSPNLPQITSSSSPLPPSDDPVSYHFYHFCYLLSFFDHFFKIISYHFLIIIYHLPHHSLDPLPPRMIQSAIMNHPPRRSRYPCHIFLAKTTTAQRRTFKKELPRKYLQWNIKLWPVVPESHIRFISTWFSAYITHRLHNVFDRCRASSSSQVRLSIKRWNCGIGIFHSIGSFPDLTTN